MWTWWRTGSSHLQISSYLKLGGFYTTVQITEVIDNLSILTTGERHFHLSRLFLEPNKAKMVPAVSEFMVPLSQGYDPVHHWILTALLKSQLHLWVERAALCHLITHAGTLCRQTLTKGKQYSRMPILYQARGMHLTLLLHCHLYNSCVKYNDYYTHFKD